MDQRSILISGKKDASLRKVFTKILIGNILGWVVYTVGAFADSIIGGSFLGEEALAAIEIVTPIFSLIYFFGYLISSGEALLRAKAIGENDFKKAELFFSSGFYVSILVGLALGLAMLFGKEAWLSLYDLTPEIYSQASEYYNPFIVVGFFLPLGLYLYQNICSDGSALIPIIGDISQTFVNLVLSLILIRTLGIRGLSLATLIGTIFCYTLPCIYFFTKANTCKLKFVFSIKTIWPSIKMGLTTTLTCLAVALLDIVMNVYICYKFDASYVAPYALVNFSLEIASALALVGQTMVVLLNFAIGEKNIIDIKALLKHTKKVGVFVALIFSAIFMGLSPLWPSLFGLETEEFIKYTLIAALSIGASFIFATFFSLFLSYNVAFENIKLSSTMSLLNSFIYPLIFPIVLSLIFGYTGFVIGFALTNIISLITAFLYSYIKNKTVFVLPKYQDNQYVIDLTLNPESINKAVIEVKDILLENKIETKISNRIQLTVEESLTLILKENKNKKVSSRLLLQIDKNVVKLLEKDTGKIFNVTSQDQKISDLSNFVFTQLNTKTTKVVNYVSSSLNGNHYEFKLK